MDKLITDLSVEEYLTELVRNFDSPFLFGSERVTGVVIGPFFSVAHHCAFEWNRRITSECSRAIGYVRAVDGRTEVNYMRSKGVFCISWLVFTALVFLLLGAFLGELDLTWVLCSVGMSLFLCYVSSAGDSMTENGRYGAGEITKLLLWPDQYYKG